MKLRVMSYNIHRAIGVDRRFRLERMVNILGHYQADVMLLQEVDAGVPRSRGLDLARKLAEALDYAHYAVGHNVTLKRGRYGNATLSRHPIVEARNIDLTVDRHKKRGCQYTAIQLREQSASRRPAVADFFNLHLGLSARERMRQLGLLARSSEFASLPPDGAAFVGGDFNDWRGLLAPVFVDVLGFGCATNYRSDPWRPMLTYPSFAPRGGLDKIFYRGRVRLLAAHPCYLRLARVASDHLAVITDFDV